MSHYLEALGYYTAATAWMIENDTPKPFGWLSNLLMQNQIDQDREGMRHLYRTGQLVGQG